MSAESRSVLLCKLLVLLLESVARGLAALEGLLHVLDLNGAQLRLDIARFPALVVPVQQPPQRPRGKEGNTEMNCLRELACILCRGAQSWGLSPHRALFAQLEQVGSRVTVRGPRNPPFLSLHLEFPEGAIDDRLPRLPLRQAHIDPLLEPAEHRGVELPRQVGRGQHKHELPIALGGCQSVHLHQELGLHAPARLVLALSAPCHHQRVDLVEEDCGGGVVPGQLEENPDELLRVPAPLADDAGGADVEEGRSELLLLFGEKGDDRV